jgi:hypothetical protein
MAQTSLSYKHYVTLIRNQPSGGCGTYASVAILDILKKKEYDGFFSPNTSVRFAEQRYNDPTSTAYHKQLEVLTNYGCCSETTMPTNYDRGSPDPTPGQLAEAESYKLLSRGDEEQPTIEKIRNYLTEFGPVWTVLWLGPHNAGDEGHIVAIIGYDDTKQEFEFVNSFGDRKPDWPEGFGVIPYENLSTPKLFPNIIAIRKVINRENPNPVHRFAARIKIVTSGPDPYGRNMLRVKIGVEGQEPLIVWDRNNHYEGKTGLNENSGNDHDLVDNSTTLFIDVPLPTYAGLHWPPCSRLPILPFHPGLPELPNYWYLEVENHSLAIGSSSFHPTGVVATIQQASLMDFSSRVQFDFGPGASNIVQPNSVQRVQIAGALPLSSELNLSAQVSPPPNNRYVYLTGSFSTTVEYQSNYFQVPRRGERIGLYGLVRFTPTSGYVPEFLEWIDTDAEGKFNTIYMNSFEAYRVMYGDENEPDVSSRDVRPVQSNSPPHHKAEKRELPPTKTTP